MFRKIGGMGLAEAAGRLAGNAEVAQNEGSGMNVFTYGSLMFSEVWERVTGLRAPGLPARLEGYEARKIGGQSYPALVRAEGAVTEGVLYAEVGPEALARLDSFEGDFYLRREVEVILCPEAGDAEEPRRRRAQVYVAAWEEHPDILVERWEAEAFRERHLAGFLKSDPGFSGRR